jgi:LuxR family maltose regulon positive regulatory protein
MEAEALYHAGEFAKAAVACEAGLGMAERHHQLGNEFCAAFLKIRLALAAGDADALFGRDTQPGLMAQMRKQIVRNRDYFLLHTVDVCEGWLYAALGLHERIPFWLRVRLNEDSRLYAFARGYYYIVHGRALLLAGEDAKLTGLFSAILHAGSFQKNLLFSVYAHIYLAAALEKTGKRREAASALSIALDAALPDALYMPFVENHDLIGPLLTKLLTGKHRDTLSRIETLAQRMKAGCKRVLQAAQDPKQHFKLSEREFEVACLACQGLSNEDIGDELRVTGHTAKAHLRSVYQKSGAKDRAELRKIFKRHFAGK